MTKTIAIVEDEGDIANLISLHISKSGFKPIIFNNGNLLLSYLQKNIPDLIILDLMLPDIDGLEICKIIQKKSEWRNIPIIIVSAKSEDIDKVVGLEIGADDYLTKPFSPRELVARIKALLRRKSITEHLEQKLIQTGSLIINPHQFSATINNKNVNLTLTEFKILYFLAANSGQIFSRAKLLDIIWGTEKAILDRTIDVHIKNLREKIGEYGKRIINVRGIGYKFDQ